ncbi:MAG: NuoM family protein [Bacteroidota bacterium]|jgi:NADH-quinone oxidoreductase subunit M
MQILSLFIVPLVGLLLVRLMPDSRKAFWAGMAVSLVSLADVLVKMISLDPASGFQMVVDQYWVKDLGISFYVGMDGLSMVMVFLTALLVPLIIYSSADREIPDYKNLLSLVFFMQAALYGVFVSLDGFLFYVFWELALIPIWFICLLWGGKDRIRITLKFFIYTLSGSLLMLLGIIWLWLQTPGAHSFDINSLMQLSLTESQQSWVFWAFFLAFAIKIPIFPFHTWQPDTYVSAPTTGTMLLSGIMLKMGLFGLIRWVLPIVPGAVDSWSWLAIGLAVIGVVYAALMAMAQTDFKRMAAYSSMSHVGLIAAAVLTAESTAVEGATYQMISHGVNAIGLFFVAEILQRRFADRGMDEMGGLAHVSRPFAIGFMVIMLGNVALPLTNGFVGEFLMLSGIYNYGAWTAAIAGLSVILGAVYMLNAYRKTTLGETSALSATFTPLSTSEKTLLLIIGTLVILGGIYPKYLMDIAGPSLQTILNKPF